MSGRSTSSTAAAGRSAAMASMAGLPRLTRSGSQPSAERSRPRSVKSSWLSSTTRILGIAGTISGAPQHQQRYHPGQAPPERGAHAEQRDSGRGDQEGDERRLALQLVAQRRRQAVADGAEERQPGQRGDELLR